MSMEKEFWGFVALIAFSSPFIALPIIVIVKLWKKRKRAAGRQTPAQAASEKKASPGEPVEPSSYLEQIYPTLNQAAGDFLRQLSDQDFKGDLILAAEMAGLKLLRNSGVDLGRHTPGHILLGAIPDEVYKQMQRFIFSWSLGNGLPVDGFAKARIPDADKDYRPQVSQLETGFDAACRKHGLTPEDTPYAAALAALKLVSAGKELGLIEPGTGLYMLYFHLVSGSKMVPEPLVITVGQ
jgi:hypothetical protein